MIRINTLCPNGFYNNQMTNLANDNYCVAIDLINLILLGLALVGHDSSSLLRDAFCANPLPS